MKIICISIIMVFLLLIHAESIFAQTVTSGATATESATPTKSESAASKTIEIINDFKDRIASRVAQLKLVKKRGILGTVKEISGTQITLNDMHNNTRFVDVDELTKFSSPSAKGTFGLSDLTKGTQVGVLGLYNKQSNRILARFVDVDLSPHILHGKVTEIDTKNFTFDITLADNKTQTIDVSNSTRIQQYKKDTGALRAGFSRILEEELIVAVGYPDKKNANLFLASRIILFPEIGTPQAATSPTPTKTATSSDTRTATSSAR